MLCFNVAICLCIFNIIFGGVAVLCAIYVAKCGPVCCIALLCMVYWSSVCVCVSVAKGRVFCLNL